MNKSNLYFLAALFTTCVFFLTGCPNSVSTSNLQNVSSSNSDTITIKGSVSTPSAMSENSRMAISNFTTDKDNNSVVYKVTATAIIDGESKTVNSEINISVNNWFYFEIPNENASWSIYVEMFAQGNALMKSQTQTFNVQGDEPDYYISNVFYLTPVNQTNPDNATGNIHLTVKKDEYSTIKKIKWQLNPIGSATQTQPIVFTNNPAFDETTLVAVLNESNIPAGTYEAQLSFIDANGMLYGPVYELMTVSAGFVTDTWFQTYGDVFVRYSSQDEKFLFTLPSDSNLSDFFPNYYRVEPIQGDIALLWNYDETGEDYKVYPIDNSGTVDVTGYPFAKNVGIQDTFIDFETNDMYVISIENKIIKYTAQSGYSDSITNIAQDEQEYIIAAAANNGQAFVLTASTDIITHTNTFKLYKFNNNGTQLIPAGNNGLNLSSYAYQAMDPNFHMALQDKNLFITYTDNSGKIYCELLNETNDYSENVWSSAPCFANSSDFPGLMVNDIIAIPDAEQEGTINVYVLLGRLYVHQLGYQAFSYGGIIKFTSTSSGGSIDQSYGPTYGTTSGIRGITPNYGGNFVYNKNETEASSAFYNPVKIIGKSNSKYLIADDGAQFTLDSQEREVLSCSMQKRIVTLDFSAASFESFDKIQVAWCSFDNAIGGSETKGFTKTNLKQSFLNAQGSLFSPSYFIDLNSNSQNVGLDNEWEVEIEAASNFGDYRDAFDDNGAVTLPRRNCEPLRFYVQPHYWDVQYNAVLYCNGKDLNDGVSPGEEYYTVDAEAGTLTLNRGLPLMGKYDYTLGLEIIQTAYDKNENPTQMRQDFLFRAMPDTKVLVEQKDDADQLIQFLNSLVIGDTIELQCNIKKDLDSYWYNKGLPIETTMSMLHDFVNQIDCPNLTLNYDISGGYTELDAGTFGVNCNRIKLPKKTSKGGSGYLTTIKKGVFTKNDINFEGDLELHKSITTIDNGVFAIPPRSVIMDNKGYVANESTVDTTKGAFEVRGVVSNTSDTTLLARIDSYLVGNIITCTKRDEPFTLDFSTSYYQKLNQIYDNAFKGLPVVADATSPLNLGYANAIGQHAFEGTCVSAVKAGSDLSIIGNKAFPAGTTLDLTDNSTLGTWYYCTATADTYDEIWDYCWGSSITDVSTITPTPQSVGAIEGDTKTEQAENIMDKINLNYTFVFKKLDN